MRQSRTSSTRRARTPDDERTDRRTSPSRSPQAPRGARRPRDRTRTIAGSLPGARSIAARLLHGTPGRMRLFALLGVVAAVALGTVSANALLASQSAVERAANNTAQVVRAQSIHVDLLRADAVATNAFLVGGLESPESRARLRGRHVARRDRRRGGRGRAARRRRRARRAVAAGADVRRPRRAGPHEQPARPAGRGAVPHAGQRRAARGRHPHRHRGRRGQRAAGP